MQTLTKQEELRLLELKKYEKNAKKQGYLCIAGVDEAGRGPLAGPVVAAACILPEDFLLAGVNDSKQLTSQQREYLFQQLNEDSRVICGVGVVDSLTIDEINIYQATIKAMLMAIEDLSQKPDCLLVDGMKLPGTTHCEKIIKGDERSLSIASASIIAKVTRDRMMVEYHEQWPEYGFDRHKGYSTAAHMEALEKHGPCPVHRASFEPVKSLLAKAIC